MSTFEEIAAKKLIFVGLCISVFKHYVSRSSKPFTSPSGFPQPRLQTSFMAYRRSGKLRRAALAALATQLTSHQLRAPRLGGLKEGAYNMEPQIRSIP